MRTKRRTQEGTSSFSVLPVEIIENILSTLPVKTLIRLQSVCKLWHAIISNPRFHRIHYHTTRNDNLYLVMRFNHSDFEQLVRPETLKIRSGYPSGEPAFAVGACNGIVLMLKHFDGVSYLGLWNPSIRNHYGWISCRPGLINGSDGEYGLYYDPQPNDYQIVMFSNSFYSVYSCKSAIWGEPKALPCLTSRVIFNGFNGSSSFYWLDSEDEAVCFDVRDEKSSRIALPTDVTSFLSVRLWQMRSGRLGLMGRKGMMRRFWVLEKDNSSWRELVNNNNADDIDRGLRRYVIYNHGGKGLEEFERCERISEGYLLPYSESLCFPIPDFGLKRKRAMEPETRRRR